MLHRFNLIFQFLPAFSGHRPAQREVPSLPNPTTCQDWPHHRGLVFRIIQISESAVRRDLRFFVLIRED